MTACRLAVVALLVASRLDAAPPLPTDPRLVLELVAREPDIVTPTGIAVDEQGRVWVVENHTHQRPADYKGPKTDRVRVYEDFGPDGRARKMRTFAEGFRNSMGLALGERGAVVLVTRSAIHVLRDHTGKGVVDEDKVIVRLETTGDYPHNGLAGCVFDALGNLYFGLGENLGAEYKVIGSDDTTLQGGGEGGSVYRCRPDGTGLVRVATGFWNPFGQGIDAFGRLFIVDNDPDSRGPCRLAHVVQGGDYGYRYRNGRKGLHPFTAWDGELPGTLPMTAGTGEAPCAVVPYEANGLPSEYRGELLVTSWGDHLVERFHLEPAGASFRGKSRPVVRGGDDFRPVGLTVAPDGSIYLSDWVDKSYPVHGKGRIWRLRWKDAPKDDGLRPSAVASLKADRLKELLHDPRRDIRQAAAEALAKRDPDALTQLMKEERGPRARVQAMWALAKARPAQAADVARLAANCPDAGVRAAAAALHGQSLPAKRDAAQESWLLKLLHDDPSSEVRMQAGLHLRSEAALKDVVPLLTNADPFLVSAALEALGRVTQAPLLLPDIGNRDERMRLGLLLALRRTGDYLGQKGLPRFLDDPDPAVRRAAIQWVGEEGLKQYAPLLERAASRPPVRRDLLQALLAARQFLDAPKRVFSDEVGGDDFLARIVADTGQPAAFRAGALRMLRPDHPSLTAPVLRRLLGGSDTSLQDEALRTLAFRSDGPCQALLCGVAADRAAPASRRLDAVAGLALSAGHREGQARELLLKLLDDPLVRRDALRSLRGARHRDEVVNGVRRWWDSLPGDKGPQLAEAAAQSLLLLPADDERRSVLQSAAGPRPKSEGAWRAALAQGGDPTAGERVFFHSQGARCFACHRIDGRGAAIGPDLSAIGKALSRERLIESVLTPSKEIAPRFVAWQLTLSSGKVLTGLIVDEGPHSTVTVADNEGKLTIVPRTQIEERRALRTSIMPDNLIELMTVEEARDLIAFLTSRR